MNTLYVPFENFFLNSISQVRLEKINNIAEKNYLKYVVSGLKSRFSGNTRDKLMIKKGVKLFFLSGQSFEI